MKAELILVGGGGHCRSCIDVIEQHGVFTIAGIVDLAVKKGSSVLGYEIIAGDDELPRLLERYRFFLITLGQIKQYERRRDLYSMILAGGGELPSLVSPLAYVSRHAHIGKGTVVMHHALINAGATVGDNSIINTKALIEHDATVGSHCHVATGALVNGGAVVDDETFIGSGSVIRECIRVGRQSVIGCNLAVKTTVAAQTILR